MRYGLLIFLSIYLLSCSKPTKEIAMQPSDNISMQQLVETLNLEAHIEGGYYRQTFKADDSRHVATDNGARVTMTSIYYLLAADSPIGHFHKNSSDIMHYFHAGDPITYFLIYPDGQIETKILGPDVLSGHEYQFVVKGGVWKASELPTDGIFGYGLLGEAVAPGFEYQDMQLAEQDKLIAEFPQHADLIKRMTR